MGERVDTNMSDAAEGKRPPGEPEPVKRRLFLRSLRFVYTNYLGVTPPRPQQERTVAVVLIASVTLFLVGSVWLLLFVWETIGKASGAR